MEEVVIDHFPTDAGNVRIAASGLAQGRFFNDRRSIISVIPG